MRGGHAGQHRVGDGREAHGHGRRGRLEPGGRQFLGGLVREVPDDQVLRRRVQWYGRLVEELVALLDLVAPGGLREGFRRRVIVTGAAEVVDLGVEVRDRLVIVRADRGGPVPGVINDVDR